MVVIPISALCTEVMVLPDVPQMKECRVLVKKLPPNVTTVTVNSHGCENNEFAVNDERKSLSVVTTEILEVEKNRVHQEKRAHQEEDSANQERIGEVWIPEKVFETLFEMWVRINLSVFRL